MENGLVSSNAEEKAKCLRWFTEIANRAYESILHPADSMERNDNERDTKKRSMTFDIDNNFGQRIISCTQHHYDCINLYRKYFGIHEDCIKLADEVTTKATKLVDANEKKTLSHLTVRHIGSDLTSLLDEFQAWRDKLDLLVDTSLTVPPIKKRTSSLVSKTQVESIYTITEEEVYDLQAALAPEKRMSELEASEGEKFVLLDNSDKMFWTVKNRHGQTGELPSLFLTNCAPDATLIRKSSRLEDEFSHVVKKMLHLLESSPETLPQIKDLKRMYARILQSAAKRNKDARPMPRSPIGSRAQSRESLLDSKKEAKIIEYTTRIVETTVTEDITCYAPEYSEYVGQEVQMFLIAGVLDPRDFNEISIDEARHLGIVDTEQGVYNNTETGETIPISEAMSQGLIRVERSITKKQKEKETRRRARSYEDLL